MLLSGADESKEPTLGVVGQFDFLWQTLTEWHLKRQKLTHYHPRPLSLRVSSEMFSNFLTGRRCLGYVKSLTRLTIASH